MNDFQRGVQAAINLIIKEHGNDTEITYGIVCKLQEYFLDTVVEYKTTESLLKYDAAGYPQIGTDAQVSFTITSDEIKNTGGIESVCLLSGEPVPEDKSHTKIDPKTGLQQDYIVLDSLNPAYFIRPYRDTYYHRSCGNKTRLAHKIAATFAAQPDFYTGTYCSGCQSHFPLKEFRWLDGQRVGE